MSRRMDLFTAIFWAFMIVLVIGAVHGLLFPSPPAKPVVIDVSAESVGRVAGKASRGFVRGFVDGVKKGGK